MEDAPIGPHAMPGLAQQTANNVYIYAIFFLFGKACGSAARLGLVEGDEGALSAALRAFALPSAARQQAIFGSGRWCSI